MPYIPAAVTEEAYGMMLLDFPQMNNGKRAHTDKGIAEFRVTHAIVSNLVSAFQSSVVNPTSGFTLMSTITGGVLGGGATVATAPLTFVSDPTSLGRAQGLATWPQSGDSSFMGSLVNALCQTFKNNVQVTWVESHAAGTVASAQILPGQFPGLSAAFLAEAITQFTTDGRFKPNDTVTGVSSEMLKTLGGVCAGVDSALNTLMCPSVVYTPGASGTGAASGISTGLLS
tara:strand:+ start:6850 stop:7536 length:687 start_codon:yes stop_codon:yes gene_type:complete